MSLQNSLKILHQEIKNFQDKAKNQILNLSKFNIAVIKPNNEIQVMILSMVLYHLRNTIKEILKSKIKLKDFNKLQKTIKRFFQKFIDTPELMDFDKGTDLFNKLNENDSISLFKLLFSDIFREKINNDILKTKCNELKKSLIKFSNFKEKHKEFHSKIQFFEKLKEKFENYQKILNSGNLKRINEENLEDFRIFRSFFPLNINSEYLIDIKNRTIIKL
ncbi:MAG: hypothetical protein ACFFAH_07355 [Promethearchaeota archaeon]